jgi:cellulose synthase/poly-beta-1,6-N-acetylglucosamine synthase-like glycosyltransferase
MIESLTWITLFYFLAVNAIYLTLSAMAAVALYRNWQYRDISELPVSYSAMAPPISVLIPAFNEETTIAATVHSILQLTYSEFEVIVINDGSKDPHQRNSGDLPLYETPPSAGHRQGQWRQG